MSQYIVWKRAYIGTRLYESGEVVGAFPGIENHKCFKLIGVVTELLSAETTESENEIPTNEILKSSPGRWKLPNGEIFAGKFVEAQAAWEAIKNV